MGGAHFLELIDEYILWDKLAILLDQPLLATLLAQLMPATFRLDAMRPLRCELHFVLRIKRCAVVFSRNHLGSHELEYCSESPTTFMAHKLC